MIIPSQIVQAATIRSSRLDDKILQRKPYDFIPTLKRNISGPEIARRTQLLGAGGSRPSATELERMMGTNDLVDEFFLIRALLCARTVARISIRNPSGGERGCATGVMISPRLLLTNHHVFGRKEEAAPSIAEFNFRDDVAGNPEPSYRYALKPDRFFFTSKEFDFTLVSVEATPVQEGPLLSQWGYLRIIPESGKAKEKDWLSIIQHPWRKKAAVRCAGKSMRR